MRRSIVLAGLLVVLILSSVAADDPEPLVADDDAAAGFSTVMSQSGVIRTQSRRTAQPAGERGPMSPAQVYDLLVIAPREFAPVLDPLVAHKNATGVSAEMITLEDIYGDDTLTGDEPEQVKRAIERYERDHDTKYVMLVGDVDQFPVRWVAATYSGGPDYFYPSDLYYADLYDAAGAFATWDFDADGLFGEHGRSRRWDEDPYSVNQDRLDLHPDVAVGRVPASTVAELESYVAKVIRYEYLTFDSDWFHNVLLIAGGGRTGSRYCDPGINFSEVQRDFGAAFGDAFSYRTWIHESYYWDADEGEPTGRPCICQTGETRSQCLDRTLLPDVESLDVFNDAGWWGSSDPLPDAAPVDQFEDVGLLGWHDHRSAIRSYTRDVDNRNRFTVAFPDGCGDGNFVGPAVGGPARFAHPYVTTDGHALQVLFQEEWVDTDGDGWNERFYHITGCELDGTPHPLDGAHCGDGIYPSMVLTDDFGLDPYATAPITRSTPYVLNLPPPAPLQTDHWEWNPEIKLFAKGATGDETGWIGMAGATKGALFPNNGELLELFFEGYANPHASVAGRDRLGDVWRSMIERWLEIVFDASGSFSGDHIYDVYHIDRPGTNSSNGGFGGLEHTLMYVLSGDPSLRIGGVDLTADTEPPTTSDDTDGAWHNENVDVALTAVDNGSPPSGVRTTWHRVDGSGDWDDGTRFTVAAPSDHSNDGIHDIEYYSVDFFENTEITKSAEVKIDTTAPETYAFLDGEPAARTARSSAAPLAIGSPTEVMTVGMQGIVFHAAGSILPERPCYNSPVEVRLDAEDGSGSGVAVTEYELNREAFPYDIYPHIYTDPFPLHASDYLALHTVRYWSRDHVGNVERPHELRVCVTNSWAGMMREKMRILAGLKDLIAMRMWKDLASSLPPIKSVVFEYRFRDEPEPQWTSIGTDLVAEDGWSVEWKTTGVPNGDYGIRMTAWGFPEIQSGEQQQADKLLYQEEVGVTVSNIPDDAYAFDLHAWPERIDGGETIKYTLEFHNDSDSLLADLSMTCDLDPGFFEKLKVLDGGSLNSHGMPTWSLGELEGGESWKVHFNAKTRPDILPGTVIASQAYLTADTIPLMLSDDPSTPGVSSLAEEHPDWTAVTVNLIDGSIEGRVQDAVYGTPIAASVTIAGPVSQVKATDAAGHYAATALPPGVYTVSVQAEGYEYQSPSGPVQVTMDGTVEEVEVSFQLTLADTIPPVSTLHQTADEIVLAQSVVISGTAYDYAPGSGVEKVELSILRADDDMGWNGTSWVAGETWLPASGTTDWTVDCGGISWSEVSPYVIRSRATDHAGNVETPIGSETTHALPSPSLIAPADGAVVDLPVTFQWSLVLDSQYWIQVDDDDDFQSPEVEASDIYVNDFTPSDLAAGTYHWRVKAVDAWHGYPESAWSEVRTLTIGTEIVNTVYLPLVLRDWSCSR